MAKYFCANIVLSYFLFCRNGLSGLHVCVRARIPCNNLRIRPHTSTPQLYFLLPTSSDMAMSVNK